MQIFGYFYYKFSRPYKKWEEDDYYQMPIILLSICQSANILALLPFIFKMNASNWLYCILFPFFLLANAKIFLNSDKRVIYEEKWFQQTRLKKNFGTVFAISYIILSFIAVGVTLQYYIKYVGWDWNLNCSWRWW